jgi:hypothetical protein
MRATSPQACRSKACGIWAFQRARRRRRKFGPEEAGAGEGIGTLDPNLGEASHIRNRRLCGPRSQPVECCPCVSGLADHWYWNRRRALGGTWDSHSVPYRLLCGHAPHSSPKAASASPALARHRRNLPPLSRHQAGLTGLRQTAWRSLAVSACPARSARVSAQFAPRSRRDRLPDRSQPRPHRAPSNRSADRSRALTPRTPENSPAPSPP